MCLVDRTVGEVFDDHGRLLLVDERAGLLNEILRVCFELSELRHQFDDILEHHFGHHPSGYPAYPQHLTPIEYYREGDQLVVQVDLPGVDPKNIEVTLNGNMLTIAGERHDRRLEQPREFVLTEVNYGRFERSIRVPSGLEEDCIVATYDKGILKLVIAMPKAMEARKVHVQRAASFAADAKTVRQSV